MAKCPECGVDTEGNEVFCRGCGAELDAPTSVRSVHMQDTGVQEVPASSGGHDAVPTARSTRAPRAALLLSSIALIGVALAIIAMILINNDGTKGAGPSNSSRSSDSTASSSGPAVAPAPATTSSATSTSSTGGASAAGALALPDDAIDCSTKDPADKSFSVGADGKPVPEWSSGGTRMWLSRAERSHTRCAFLEQAGPNVRNYFTADPNRVFYRLDEPSVRHGVDRIHGSCRRTGNLATCDAKNPDSKSDIKFYVAVN